MKTLFVFFIFTKDIKICLVPWYQYIDAIAILPRDLILNSSALFS